MAELLKGRLFRFVAVTGLLFVTAIAAVDAPHLILITNALLTSISSGVMVAYAPVAYRALRAPSPSRGDVLGFGIFMSWTGTFSMRVVSIFARDLGWPDIVNTNWVSMSIVLALFGGLCHLWAPNAVEGRVPRERWVLTGIAVAVGVGIMFGLWSLRGPLGVPHPIVQIR